MSDWFTLWVERCAGSGVSVALCLSICIYLATWMDLKVGADVQARVGPNRAGAAGVLQPLASWIRELLKSSSKHGGAGLQWSWWAPMIPLVLMVGVVPTTGAGPLLRAPMSVFLALLLGLCFSWIGLIMGWLSERLEVRFASIRAASLALSATPPALMAVTVAGRAAGGFSWEVIDQAQGALPTQWIAFSGASGLLASVIFLLAGMLLFLLPPFSSAGRHLKVLMSAIGGPVGARQLWVELSVRVAATCWILLAVHLFWGGSSIPLWLEQLLGPASFATRAVELGFISAKVLLIHLLMSLTSRVMPTVRSDQAHDFAWRVLTPAAILSVLMMKLGGA